MVCNWRYRMSFQWTHFFCLFSVFCVFFSISWNGLTKLGKYKGHSESNASFLYFIFFNFVLFTSWTCENSTEPHYSFAEGIVLFSVVSTFVDILVPPLNKTMCFQTVKVAVPPPQPLAHSVLQHLVIAIMEPSQECCLSLSSFATGQTGENVTVRG